MKKHCTIFGGMCCFCSVFLQCKPTVNCAKKKNCTVCSKKKTRMSANLADDESQGRRAFNLMLHEFFEKQADMYLKDIMTGFTFSNTIEEMRSKIKDFTQDNIILTHKFPCEFQSCELEKNVEEFSGSFKDLLNDDYFCEYLRSELEDNNADLSRRKIVHSALLFVNKLVITDLMLFAKIQNDQHIRLNERIAISLQEMFCEV